MALKYQTDNKIILKSTTNTANTKQKYEHQ